MPEYDLVVRVRLPEGTDPDQFLWETLIEYQSPRTTMGSPYSLAIGQTLEDGIEFIGPKRLVPVEAAA
jgi:hypothetical protein